MAALITALRLYPELEVQDGFVVELVALCCKLANLVKLGWGAA
jgi:hypothetical protein